MRFRLTPISMTLDDIQVRIISVFRGIPPILEPTTAKRMKIPLSVMELQPIKCAFQRCVQYVDSAGRFSARRRQTMVRWGKQAIL